MARMGLGLGLGFVLGLGYGVRVRVCLGVRVLDGVGVRVGARVGLGLGLGFVLGLGFRFGLRLDLSHEKKNKIFAPVCQLAMREFTSSSQPAIYQEINAAEYW